MPPVETPVYCGNGRSAWPSVAFPPINCLKFGNGGWKPSATTAGSSMGLFRRGAQVSVLGIDLHDIHAIGGKVGAFAARIRRIDHEVVRQHTRKREIPTG